MKRTIALVAALVASLAVGASAQTAVKVKPGAGPGKGIGVGQAKPVPGTVVTPKPSGKTGTSGKTAQAKPAGH